MIKFFNCGKPFCKNNFLKDFMKLFSVECFKFMNRSKTENNMLKNWEKMIPIPVLKQLKRSDKECQANKDIVNKTN